METINVINISPEIDIQGMALESSLKSKEGRKQRILSVAQQSKLYGLQIRFWDGILSEKFPHENINKAHKQIVADAKQRGLNRVCIAEDDFRLSCKGAWEYYLQNMPEDYDIYLAGVYSGEIKEGRIMNGFSGFTMYFIAERFYDFFLNVNPLDHIDRALGNFCFEKMYRVIQPFCVFQSQGYSDNTRNKTSHEDYADGKLFKGLDIL